jgi:hypothetical protein
MNFFMFAFSCGFVAMAGLFLFLGGLISPPRRVRFQSLSSDGKTLYGVDDKGRLWFGDQTTGQWNILPGPDEPKETK